MPIENKMMFVRPNNCDNCAPPVECDSCIQGFNAIQHVIDYALQNQNLNIVDIAGQEAYQNFIFDALDFEDPLWFYGFGHGNSCVYTAQETIPVFTCTEGTEKLAGRIVYLLSCLTANGLGPKIIENGAIAYAGFNISWTWMAESTNGIFTYVDPYDDPYAFGFYESANELWLALIDGYSFLEAVQLSINKYNEWIDYWFYDNPGDQYSQSAIQWLIHDRDGLVAITECDAIDNELECTTSGCYWYDESCHGQPKQNGGFNFLLVIPIIMVVGIAFIATTGKLTPVKAKE